MHSYVCNGKHNLLAFTIPSWSRLMFNETCFVLWLQKLKVTRVLTQKTITLCQYGQITGCFVCCIILGLAYDSKIFNTNSLRYKGHILNFNFETLNFIRDDAQKNIESWRNDNDGTNETMTPPLAGTKQSNLGWFFTLPQAQRTTPGRLAYKLILYT